MVMMSYRDYDIKNLIMMQTLEPRTAGLMATDIGHVDRVNMKSSLTKQLSNLQVMHAGQDLSLKAEV